MEGHSGATVTDHEGKGTGRGGEGRGLVGVTSRSHTGHRDVATGPCGFECAGQSEEKAGGGVMQAVRRRPPLTVVKVDDGGVPGHAGVKVRHERGNVLRGCEHPVDHVARVDEPWGGGMKGRQRERKSPT